MEHLTEEEFDQALENGLFSNGALFTTPCPGCGFTAKGSTYYDEDIFCNTHLYLSVECRFCEDATLEVIS